MDVAKNQSAGSKELASEDISLDDLDLDFPDFDEFDAGVAGSAGTSAAVEKPATNAAPSIPGQDADILPTAEEEASLTPEPWGAEDEDDMGPIALSEAELENILGDALPEEEAQSSAFAEADDLSLDEELLDVPELSVDDLMDDSAQLSDEELAQELDLSLDESPLEEALLEDAADEAALDAVADEIMPEDDLPAELLAGDDELEDVGPITLSEDELSGILDDVDESGSIEGASETPVMPEAPEDIQDIEEEFSQAAELETMGDSESSFSALADDEDEGPITLTPEELGNIVSDAEVQEVESSGVEGEELSPMMGIEDDLDLGSDFGGDDLSSADFGGEDFGGADFGGDDLSAADFGGAVAEEHPPSTMLDGDDDEGPVALSEGELDAILEDVVGESEAEGVITTGEFTLDDESLALAGEDSAGPVIVLDEYEEDAAPAPERDAAGVIQESADQSHLDAEELRKMISYLDGLFDKLPDETVKEFSRSEYFDLYKKIMSELGL